MRTFLHFLFSLLLLALSLTPGQHAFAQESTPTASDSAKPLSAKKAQSPATEPNTFGGKLVEEKREATGAEKEGEEENSNLTHANPVRWLARQVGMSVHGAHLLLFCLNFAVIVILAVWAGRKILPPMFQNRTASIQRALEEARAASQDANRRLADIETRLRQLDVEIGQMQANAEKEGANEDVRIQKAAEEDIRKVVAAAEQEIASAAKQARRELSARTADLAIALARQQINVDSSTDQLLVRSFASTLASQTTSDGSGKDGR